MKELLYCVEAGSYEEKGLLTDGKTYIEIQKIDYDPKYTYFIDNTGNENNCFSFRFKKIKVLEE